MNNSIVYLTTVVVCMDSSFFLQTSFHERGQGQPFYATINPLHCCLPEWDGEPEKGSEYTHTHMQSSKDKHRHANIIFIVGILFPAGAAAFIELNLFCRTMEIKLKYVAEATPKCKACRGGGKIIHICILDTARGLNSCPASASGH